MARYGVTVDENFNLPTQVRDQLTSQFEGEFQGLKTETENYRNQAVSASTAAQAAVSTAQQAAQDAQEAAEEALAPTDEAVAGLIDDEDSATREALTQIVVPTPSLLDNYKPPFIVAHRGGPLVYPEMSYEAMEASSKADFWLEVDVQPLADGTLVCIHDATVDRTMEGVSGNVNNLTPDDWKKARIKPVIPGGISGKPMFFHEFVQKFGKDNIIVPEIKVDDNTLADNVMSIVKEYGAINNTIIQSFSWDIATRVADAGFNALYLFNGMPAQTPNTIKEAGIDFVGPNRNINATDVTALKNAGLTVISYTAKTQEAFENDLNKGMDGAFCDDPWWASGHMPYSKSPVFSEGIAGAKVRPYRFNSGGSPIITNYPLNTLRMSREGLWFGPEENFPDPDAPTSGARYIELGNLGTLSGEFTITFKITFVADPLTPTNGNGNMGLVLYNNNNNPNAIFEDKATPGQYGLTFGVRRNGRLHGWKYVNGAAASLFITDEGGPVLATQTEFNVLNVHFERTALTEGYKYQLGYSGASGNRTVRVNDSTVGLENLKVVLRYVTTAGRISDLQIEER